MMAAMARRSSGATKALKWKCEKTRPRPCRAEAERSRAKPRRGLSGSTRRGWGPAASGKKMTPDQRTLGRRNFLRALAGTPALAALGAAAASKAPVRGGPVRLGFIGLGGQGRALLGHVNPAYGEIRALCDINPASLARADEILVKRNVANRPHYAEWKEMLEKEDLDAVVIAVP